jgi:hypothetical protein
MKGLLRGIGWIGKVIAAVVIAVIVIVVIIAAAASSGVKQVQKESNEHAITQAQYDATRLGSSETAVRARLGVPNSSDSSSAQVGSAPVGQECVYYNEKGQLLHTFQFCFDQSSHKLEVKNSL